MFNAQKRNNNILVTPSSLILIGKHPLKDNFDPFNIC